MKNIASLGRLILFILFFPYCAIAQQVTAQQASEVVVTPYKTTMVANGSDISVIAIKIIDKKGELVSGANNLVTLYITGDARISKGATVVDSPALAPNQKLWQMNVKDGRGEVLLKSGYTSSNIKFEARSAGLYTGSTDIFIIHPGVGHPVVPVSNKVVFTPHPVRDKILGADISFLPQLESRGTKFYDLKGEKDAILILKEHGFNYIRLRIFNNPARDSGYSPQKGFCDLEHTLLMAKRIKSAGMKFLLDFHYSDYWADPAQQYEPKAWRGLSFLQLKQSVFDYTKTVMQALKDQGTTPDMVQVGNEINHGMIWPEGRINNLDTLANLIDAGVLGVKAVSPASSIMLHIALGGQNSESRFFVDNMIARKVPFDVIGLSYYPKWHGTLADLKANMDDLATRYHKQVMVAEYTELKTEVNDIAFNVADGKGVGTFIWEPLSTWEQVFDKTGHSNAYLELYPAISAKYHIR